MKQFDICDAQALLPELVDLASEGESFAIVKAGVPLAKLAPLSEGSKKEIKFGTLKGKIEISEDFDAPLPEDIPAAFEGRD